MINPLIASVESKQVRPDLPTLNTGDTVRVHSKIREGEKERIQVFEGVLIRQKRAGLRSTFTVRKISYGVGVERIFPLHSPRIDRIEVVSGAVVRRSRIYYIRELRGKAARLREVDYRPTAK